MSSSDSNGSVDNVFLMIACPGCGMLRAIPRKVEEGEVVQFAVCPRGCMGLTGVVERDDNGRLGIREIVSA